MTGRVTVYDFTQVIVTFGLITIQGFADGDALTSEFDSPQETNIAGSDGDIVRVRNASKLATVTCRLARGSPASALLYLWKQNPLAIPPLDQAPFIIKDFAAARLSMSPAAWILEMPAPAYGAEAPVEEWKFGLSALVVTSLLPPTG